MNKKIIGVSIAMLFAANGAFAQSTNGSSVELYGVLDAAVGTVNHSLSADPNFPATVNPASPTKTFVSNSVSGLFNSGITPSRFGIRGTEDLGGGVKAIFTLEDLFNINSGTVSNAAASLANNRPLTAANAASSTVSANSSVNGQLFSGQAFVGLSDSSMGTVTLGRQLVPMAAITANYDAVQNAQLFSPLGFSGTYAGGGVSEDKRADNSVKYTNKFGDFNVVGLYKFGQVAGNSSAGTGYSVGAGYEANGFGIQAAYEDFKDVLRTSNSAVIGDINVTNFDTTAYMIAGKYAFGDAKVVAGYESFKLKAPSTSFANLGLSAIYGYQIGNPLAGDFTGADQTTDVVWAGGDYNFTPAFNLAVGFYDIQPKASSDSKQLDGNVYEYSLIADYHFTKRTDVYAGMMYSQFKGNQYPSATYNTSNYIYAVGLRTKF